MRVLRILALLGHGLLAGMACESDPDDDVPFEAFSDDCDACLSREDCGPEWAACLEDPGCESYVVCALEGVCYRRPPGSGCEEQRGCTRPAEGEESSPLSAEFELCARTACAARCGFAGP